MKARKSDVFFSFVALNLCLLAFIALHALLLVQQGEAGRQEAIRMVKADGLTDLCLFTDARYTRNPSVADRATAFQDHPLSVEHFPSGSIIGPSRSVRHGMD